MSYERSACPPVPSGPVAFFISCGSAEVSCGAKELRRNSVVFAKIWTIAFVTKVWKNIHKKKFFIASKNVLTFMFSLNTIKEKGGKNDRKSEKRETSS